MGFMFMFWVVLVVELNGGCDIRKVKCKFFRFCVVGRFLKIIYIFVYLKFREDVILLVIKLRI